MIIDFGTVIDHSHNIGVVALVVIIKGIKEHTQPIPLVWATEHRALDSWFVCEPDCLEAKKKKKNYHELEYSVQCHFLNTLFVSVYKCSFLDFLFMITVK